MNKIFKLFASIAIVGLVFAGCQKEEEQTRQENTTAKDVIFKEIPYEVANPNYKPNYLKFGVPTPSSTATDVLPTFYDKNSITYKTRIIGSQEWLIEDWTDDCIDGDANNEIGAYTSPYYPNEGLYYEWEGIMNPTPQYIWDNYVFMNKHGFHVPTEADINTLISELGSTTFLAQKLGLNFFDDYWAGYPFNKFLKSLEEASYIWLDAPNDPSRVDGCGVLLKVKADGSIAYFYTNMKRLGTRVRLVRNL